MHSVGVLRCVAQINGQVFGVFEVDDVDDVGGSQVVEVDDVSEVVEGNAMSCTASAVRAR